MHHDPFIEDIRHFRESKAAQYGYDAEVAMKDFVRMHKSLMKTRGLLPSAVVKTPHRKAKSGQLLALVL